MNQVMPSGRTDFEEFLLDMLLEGEHPALAVLRSQAARSSICAREMTGSGFLLYFEVPETERRVEPPNFALGDIEFELPGAEINGEAVLLVRNGVLSVLDVFSRDGRWPEEIMSFEIKYFGGRTRDMGLVDSQING